MQKPMLNVSYKCKTVKFFQLLSFAYFLIPAELQANLRGTEIFNPLEQIFQKPPIDGYLRQVFVLTDGQVINYISPVTLF
jgi:hypothetical protein